MQCSKIIKVKFLCLLAHAHTFLFFSIAKQCKRGEITGLTRKVTTHVALINFYVNPFNVLVGLVAFIKRLFLQSESPETQQQQPLLTSLRQMNQQ